MMLRIVSEPLFAYVVIASTLILGALPQLVAVSKSLAIRVVSAACVSMGSPNQAGMPPRVGAFSANRSMAGLDD
jgi:hypothetical protein